MDKMDFNTFSELELHGEKIIKKPVSLIVHVSRPPPAQVWTSQGSKDGEKQGKWREMEKAAC